MTKWARARRWRRSACAVFVKLRVTRPSFVIRHSSFAARQRNHRRHRHAARSRWWWDRGFRVSGKSLAGLAAAICGKSLTPRLAQHTRFRDAADEVIDDGIALFFAAPHRSPVRTLLELHAHGSPIVLQALVRRCVELGARHAEPGEFTRRAYLNGNSIWRRPRPWPT